MEPSSADFVKRDLTVWTFNTGSLTLKNHFTAKAMTNSFYTIAPGLKDVDDIISEVFYVKSSDLQLKNRHREISEARQFAMFFRKNFLHMTTHQIGSIYNRDHATVIHADHTVNDLMSTNKTFRSKAETALKILQSAGYGTDQ
jgi:chromosomal replication initiation ATPase DnaA